MAAPNGIAWVKGELSAISANSPFGVASYDSREQMTGGAVKPDSSLCRRQDYPQYAGRRRFRPGYQW
jgi:hypothetical protein